MAQDAAGPILTDRMEKPITGPRPLKVETPVFEGPLELLLALAEREEVDIFQVSLARVTDAYLAEIAQRETPDPQETELLGWEEDVRQRLEEYRAYKAMAQELMARAEQETFAFPPPPRPPEPGGQEEPLEVDALVAAFNSVLARIPPRPVVVTGRTWTLEEKLDLIRERIAQGPVELLGLILESEDRLEAVVTFVAVLELLRRSVISVRQKERFGPIHIEARPA